MKQPSPTLREFRRQYAMHIFVWCGMLFLLLFSLIPMLGIVISFSNYKIKTGFVGMFQGPWVGFKNFLDFLTHRKFDTLVRNTLSISVLKLVFAFPLPIFFAIIITEMRGKVFKRLVQTASYLPHFISWTIVAGILHAFFSTNTGMVNEVLMNLGIISEPLPLLISEDWYYFLAVASEMWKETGWNAIIYLAAIAGIDPTLYESAQIDGAGRIKRICHITIPCILPTISVLLIMQFGYLFGANFDQAMLLGNSLNLGRSEIIEVFVYNLGLNQGRYSLATAAGLFQSVISLILVIMANNVSKKLSGASLF